MHSYHGQLENVECFNYLGSMIKKIMQVVLLKLNPGFPWQKRHSTTRSLFFATKLDLNVKEETSKLLTLELRLHGAETWTLRKIDQKYMESYEICCWRRIEKISWADLVRNEVLHRVKEGRNILRTVKRRKDTWIGHIVRRNCLRTRVFEG
jgi:hypothetical protein